MQILIWVLPLMGAVIGCIVSNAILWIFYRRKKQLIQHFLEKLFDFLKDEKEIDQFFSIPEIQVELDDQLDQVMDKCMGGMINRSPLLATFLSGNLVDNLKNLAKTELRPFFPYFIKKIGDRKDLLLPLTKRISQLSNERLEKELWSFWLKLAVLGIAIGAIVGLIFGWISWAVQ